MGILKENKREKAKKKEKKKVKIYLGISLELLWAVWVQFGFR